MSFFRDSQVGVPKLGLLLFQDFGCSYMFQINFILRVQGQYFIAFENTFLMVYNTFQQTSFDPLLLKDLQSKVKFPI